MESTALEEKINKIRLRNEEIKRRHEEVEADKKNAAKLDALIEPVPTEDWPERKEPPEFSASAPKQTNKSKHSIRKHGDQGTQYYAGSGDGKKAHGFADGQGPPPDPKYNFLADSEREEYGEQIPKDSERNRGRNKTARGGFRRRGSGRDWHAKEQWGQQANPGDMTLPEYEAWRAERNRIDEARISRQRTAEGNWRREWDNDKVHLVDDVTKRDNRVTLGDVVSRQEHGENEKHYRSPRMAPRNLNFGGHREPHYATAGPEANKNHGSAGDTEKRVVIATDKSIKVSVNHGTTPPKPSVMSVKVSSTTIAGTGRVGPRQRPRVMYSSQSEADVPIQERPAFTRHKSAEEKIKARQTDQAHKAVSPKSPRPQRHREGDAKSPYPQKRDNERADGTGKPFKKDAQKSPYPQRRGNASSNYPPKSPRVHRRSTESFKQRHNSDNSNATSVRGASDVEGADGVLPKSLDSSAAIDDDKSNESLNHADRTDDKVDSVPLKKSLVETSATPVVEQVFESANDCKENDCKDSVEQPGRQESANPEIASALETERVAQCVGGTTDECSDNFYGEASGTQEAKSTVESAPTKDNDEETTDSQAINCSADSGLTSNDSGFIEQPSNDSIHDVSESETLETSGIADTSSESVDSGARIAEGRSVTESLAAEVKVPDALISGTAEASPSNLEIKSEPETVLAGTSEEGKSKESTIESNVAASAESISQAKDAETPASVPEGADKSHDVANYVEDIQSIKVESKETDSSSGEADVTRDAGNSSFARLESHETPASVAEETDNKSHDMANEIANTESIKVESKEVDSSSLRGELDATKDADNSPSAQLESHTEGAEVPVSLHGKLAETPANVPEEADNKFQDITNEIANTESLKVESTEMDSSSIRGEVDATIDAGSSSSAQLKTNIEEAQTPTSLLDELAGNPQDAANDDASKSVRSEPQDKVAAPTEKLVEAVEDSQETKITSNDGSKNANDIVEESTIHAEESSSPPIEKH